MYFGLRPPRRHVGNSTPPDPENPVRDIELVRSFVDGRFVFIQAAQSLNNGEARWVTTDLFDPDGNGKT